MSKYEQDLLANPYQKAFYKYINIALSRLRQPIWLLDGAGNTVPKGIQTAEVFSNEFSQNFPTSVTDSTITNELNRSSTIALFNTSYCDTMVTLLALSNTVASPDRI